MSRLILSLLQFKRYYAPLVSELQKMQKRTYKLQKYIQNGVSVGILSFLASRNFGLEFVGQHDEVEADTQVSHLCCLIKTVSLIPEFCT